MKKRSGDLSSLHSPHSTHFGPCGGWRGERHRSSAICQTRGKPNFGAFELFEWLKLSVRQLLAFIGTFPNHLDVLFQQVMLGRLPTAGFTRSTKGDAVVHQGLECSLRPLLEPSTSGRHEPLSVYGAQSRRLRSISTRVNAMSPGGEILPSGLFLSGRGNLVAASATGSATAAPMPSTAPSAPRSHIEAPYVYVSGQRVHSLHDRGLEVIQGLSSWAERDLMRLLKPTESCWQPTDFLPDSSSPDFYDEVRKLGRYSISYAYNRVVRTRDAHGEQSYSTEN